MNSIETLDHEGYRIVRQIHNSNIGVAILVKSSVVTDDSEFRDAAGTLFNLISNAEINADPKTAERNKQVQDELRACFNDVPIGYNREIPNEYCPDACCTNWLLVTTKAGNFKIGWRKRVIVIDWSDTDVKKDADTLFPEEDVTKHKKMIHAWNYEKAKAYINTIHANMPPVTWEKQ